MKRIIIALISLFIGVIGIIKYSSIRKKKSVLFCVTFNRVALGRRTKHVGSWMPKSYII